MTDSEKKILDGFLLKTLKLSAEDVAGLYNEAGELTDLTVAEKVDADRFKKSKSENSDQYKRGIKEGASKVEKAVKDKYDVDSDLEGVELIDFIIADKIGEAKGNTEDITKSPEFLKHQHEWEKQQKLRDKEWEQKIVDKEHEFNKRAILTKIEKRALGELDKLRPILPEDAKKAQRWREKYFEDFRNYDYQESGDDIMLIKDGERVKDTHGHPISFEDFARETAESYFDFKAADDRSSSGNKNEPSKPPIRAAKDDEEFFSQMKAEQDPKARIAIKESYEKSKKK